MAASGFGLALEDIGEGNNLPCVLPTVWGRQFRVRGDVQATLLCGRAPQGGMTTALKISRRPDRLSKKRRPFSWFQGERKFMTTDTNHLLLLTGHAK
jgi:hypothetical protein